MSNNQLKRELHFKEAYESLNAEQRTAVDAIEGPVMVIAGPGTGKTQILATRIGKILLETDAQAENILCLTYTDAGAVAMRKRLLQFIGADAYKVNIFTFHAFCNEVIQDNLSQFNKTVLDPISELEKIQLFKELIDTLPKNHILKRYRGDVYFESSHLQSLFSTMKREGWTPEFLNGSIEAYLKELDNDDQYKYKSNRAGKWKIGDPNPAYYEEVNKMEKLKAAVGQFDRFTEMMKNRNRYDFEDMINWVIQAFEDNNQLLAVYQERFQYILVDEYQDTSGTQNKLVQLLISYWDQPNVFVVGDDDQSIFRFQGANVENMLAFAEKYEKDLVKVVLTNNYRSTQPILDTSKVLINKNKDRLVHQIKDLSKELISSNDEISHLQQVPTVFEYETEHHEMIGIVKKTQSLLKDGIQPGNIGIIYKENKYGDELTRYYQLLNIPVYSKRSINALEIPLAKKLILILKYLSAEHFIPYSGDALLFEILHFDWFNIPPIDIAKITIEVSKRNYKNKTSIRELLQEKITTPADDLFTSNIYPNLQKAAEILEKLIGDVPNQTLQVLFENIIRDAGVISNIMNGNDKHWELRILTALFDFLKDETHRNPSLSIHELVPLIELMEQEEIKLPITQISGSEDGINIMTAHGSKGLEFDYVFIVGTNADLWEKKKANTRQYKVPSTVFKSHLTAKDDQELRRLFYVALTRAKKELSISYSKYKLTGKEMEPSKFIAEIQEKDGIVVGKIQIEKELLSEFIALQLEKNTAPEIGKMEDDIVGPVLDKFVMNVTALNSYLKCPLGFYFNNFLRIPSAKNESTEFGSAIHYALQTMFEKMLSHPAKQYPDKKEVLEYFDFYMKRHRESFSKEQFKRRIEYGTEVLEKYYEKYIAYFNSNKIVLVEYNVNNVTIGNIPLKGKIDKLEFNGKLVNVVDYKSGDPDKGIKKLKGPSENDPDGNDYWRQAVFYKILIDNKKDRDWVVNSTEFDFVEPNNKKEYKKEKIAIQETDVTTVTNQIKLVWEKIQNREFYVGCGKPTCHWCNFAKTNKLAVALHETENEEE